MDQNQINELVQQVRAGLSPQPPDGEPQPPDSFPMWGVANILDVQSQKGARIIVKFLRKNGWDDVETVLDLTNIRHWRLTTDPTQQAAQVNGSGKGWIITSFGRTAACIVDFTNNTGRSWIGNMEAMLTNDQVILADDGTPNVVLVVDFTRFPSYLFNKIRLMETITKCDEYYPHIFVQKIFIGGFVDRFISRWKFSSSWNDATSLRLAHKPLFKYLGAPAVFHEYGGLRDAYELDRQKPRKTQTMIVPHGTKKTFTIVMNQGLGIYLMARVIHQWGVVFTAVFVPAQNVYFPILLREREYVPSSFFSRDVFARHFRAPVDGVIQLVVENSSFSSKKLLVVCERTISAPVQDATIQDLFTPEKLAYVDPPLPQPGQQQQQEEEEEEEEEEEQQQQQQQQQQQEEEEELEP